MNKILYTTIILCFVFIVILLSYFTLTIEVVQDNDNYKKNNPLNNQEIFAQEDDKSLVVKNSKKINLSGTNYAEIVASRDIHLNNFTISTWFNTNMNVTGQIGNAFLINKGGFGTDREGFNLNYGLWLGNRERVNGGFETSIGDDYYLNSQGSYADGVWHNAILTFDSEQHMLKLYMDGLEVATNTTKVGITPDNIGKQPIRIGANSLVENGIINGNYTGQIDDIQIWNYAFTKEQVTDLFETESKISR
ncbi:MAG TPA: LamG domain-containing protein [Nitrososphaeraceae archaeon]|nr:LamG domain-containing protein [Nitrososphaeraceae archaeon]